MKKLENKCALVTSATRGIGLACCLALAEEGATVYMGARQMDAASEICEKYFLYTLMQQNKAVMKQW